MLNKNFNNQFRIVLIAISFLLLEGLYSYYYYSLSRFFDFLEYRYQTGYNKFIWEENGIVENLQLILLFFSMGFIFKTLIVCKNIRTKVLLSIYFIGITYYFFEEMSWGQHFFKWSTPDYFETINSQNETNLHNINNLFNQLPRNLLLIWCCFSFLFVKINFTKLDIFYLKEFIFPNNNLRKISYLLIIVLLPNFVVSNIEFLEFGDREVNNIERLLKTLSILVSFNYVKLSELHELLFDYYIITHAYYLYALMKKNVNHA